MRILENINIAGVMSGTSLDGLDIAVCNFDFSDQGFVFNILDAKTLFYNDFWKEKLSKAHLLNARDFMLLHNEYGRFIGQSLKDFISKSQLNVELIASHGHTIMHEPEKLMTVQLGNGAAITAESGISCVSDFRNLDVCLGGQGAPLVPVGDYHLFNSYDACINIGGFSNITILNQKPIVAFDVCPVNILLNHYTRKIGYDFDENGEIARSGNVDTELLSKLNQLECFDKFPRNSMSREWVETIIAQIIDPFGLPTQDILRTIIEFVSLQISKVTSHYNISNTLVTGGGAHNSFLIQRIIDSSKTKYIIPDKKIIDYKEALIFAFLGLMRVNNLTNVFSSITGASKDSCSGIIWK